MKPATLLISAATALCSQTAYLLRHGEKPPGEFAIGLSAEGKQRAQCLRSVFGARSLCNIGCIIVPKYESDGSGRRSYDTVSPLAADLGLTINTPCGRDDSECVAKAVREYTGSGNILICWEHKRLRNIAEDLGADAVGKYPVDRFDVIWTDPHPYTEITSATSEKCPGLDEQWEDGLSTLSQKTLLEYDYL
ncbi:hypothetical protein B0J13DRAFT_641984 [Dactylonectria estremocensis]|uniref:Phosphoglycerate mutase family protein n=1 Tax=Dactylonectria estremocensis TaxID=1079267 RepID=A0A9P9EA68_9HYPO|nr:hypothetical protein B0J13DRAFT_641984 [Dactylonectria estremocensis]